MKFEYPTEWTNFTGIDAQPQKIEILWHDAWEESDAVPIAVLVDEDSVHRSHIGYLVHEDDKNIIVASDIYKTPHGQVVVCGRQIFPRGMIKEIIYLEKASD